MSIRDYPGLKDGVTARLPGDYARQSDRKALRPAPLDLPASSWTIRIPDWWPTPLNQLINRHHMAAHRLKKTDAQLIQLMAQRQGVPAATGKRRVSLVIILPPRRRAPDPDAFWKSLLDGLVGAGLLRNDSQHWVECSPVEFARGKRLCSYVTLEELG